MGFIQLPQRKRIIKKLARTKRLEKAKREHQEWLRSQNLTREQLKNRIKDSPVPFPTYESKRKMPKTSDRITNMSGRVEPQQYSGERKLLGIGAMHKSNLVPIFDEESAKEISKMRRN
jgi:hypothetical protein